MRGTIKIQDFGGQVREGMVEMVWTYAERDTGYVGQRTRGITSEEIYRCGGRG